MLPDLSRLALATAAGPGQGSSGNPTEHKEARGEPSPLPKAFDNTDDVEMIIAAMADAANTACDSITKFCNMLSKELRGTCPRPESEVWRDLIVKVFTKLNYTPPPVKELKKKQYNPSDSRGLFFELCERHSLRTKVQKRLDEDSERLERLGSEYGRVVSLLRSSDNLEETAQRWWAIFQELEKLNRAQEPRKPFLKQSNIHFFETTAYARKVFENARAHEERVSGV